MSPVDEITQALDQYAGAVWQPSDLIEIRALPTRRDSATHPRSLWAKACDIPSHAGKLQTWNDEGLNIYAGICPRRCDGGTTDGDTLPGRAIWADYDHIEPRAAWKRAIKASMPRPTMAVNSGHGCHIFWGLDDQPDLKELCELVRDVARLTDGDPSVKNASRILRLPGYMNLKDPPMPCKLLHVEPETRYEFGALRRQMPSQIKTPTIAKIRPRSESSAPDEYAQLVKRGRLYAETIEGSGPGGRTHAAYRVAAALRNDLGLAEADALPILEDWDVSSNQPTIASDYGPRELQQIIRNTEKYHKKEPLALVHSSRQNGTSPSTKSPPIPIPADTAGSTASLAAVFDAEAKGERETIALPWPRLSTLTNALRPGTVTILAGPAGNGKTLFALHIAVNVFKTGKPFMFLPLEDSKTDFQRRVLAHLANDWRVIDDSRDDAAHRKAALNTFEQQLVKLDPCVCENPRHPVRDNTGRPTVPPLPYQKVIDWIGQAAETARVIFIDPIAQIDFGDRNEWRGQSNFMRQVTGHAACSGCSLVLVAHTIKRPGRAATPLTGEDVQGAAEFKRLCHTTLLLDAHDEKASEVWREGGCRETVLHDKTVIIDKTRNGSGRGNRVAFILKNPVFEEIGIIAPSDGKRKTNTSKSADDARMPYKD